VWIIHTSAGKIETAKYTGKHVIVVERTTDKAATTCSNPSECLQVQSEYVTRSEWTNMIMSSFSNMSCQFLVPKEFVQYRKYKWSILGSSWMKIIIRSLCLYNTSHKRGEVKPNLELKNSKICFLHHIMVVYPHR